MAPNRRHGLGRGGVPPALLALLLVGAACGAGAGQPTSTGGSRSAGSPSPAVASSVPASIASPPAGRPEPPAGFPAYPGALPAALPDDDPGVAARWSTLEVGAAPYDFYLEALAAAGFTVLGRYPGGGGAVIVFDAAGTAWQVVISPENDRLLISLQLDRP
jgi:hypothetical protein